MRSLTIAKPDINQWKQMSSQLQSLPEELLVQILGYLPKSDIKSARLTCSQSARTGAKWLFQRVYFAPRVSTIEDFINISSNPVFARTVTELVYDGRLFIPELTNYEPYKKALDAFAVLVDLKEMGDVPLADVTGAEDYHESLADSLVRYTRLLEQQQRVFQNHDDYKALCEGLKRLPNISTVIVLENFSECNDSVPPGRDDYSWYHRRSQCEIAMPVRPTSWDPDVPNLKTWDVHGVQHLLLAVSQHGNHVVQLQIGSEFSSAPISVFGNQDVCDNAYRMMSRLDLFKVHLYMVASSSEAEWAEQKDRLSCTLSEAKNLHCLAISGVIGTNVLKNKVWQHLETLNLGDMHLHSDDLKEIIQSHSNTLRELRLLSIYLFGKKGWADVAEQIGKYLVLRSISILGLADDVPRETNDICLEVEDIEAVARSFMQSVTRTTLLRDENGVSIFACPEESEDSKPHSP